MHWDALMKDSRKRQQSNQEKNKIPFLNTKVEAVTFLSDVFTRVTFKSLLERCPDGRGCIGAVVQVAARDDAYVV